MASKARYAALKAAGRTVVNVEFSLSELEELECLVRWRGATRSSVIRGLIAEELVRIADLAPKGKGR